MSARFDVHAFCTECGAHRQRMPFGQHSRFFNDTDGPCGRCGAPSPGWDGQHTCRRVLPGRWPFGRAIWLNRDGVRVDVPVSGRDEPDEASQSTRPLTPKTPESAGDLAGEL